MELLAKSFGDFKQGMESLKLTHENLLSAYCQHEQQRKEKLCAAKLERMSIKQSEKRMQCIKASTSTEDTKLAEKVC